MPSADPPSEAASQMFSGVRFFLSRGLPTATFNKLREELLKHGGIEAENTKLATHVISTSNCFIGVDDVEEAIIATPTWVERSLILGKLQNPRYFSADPRQIFSGIVASGSDLPVKDHELIASGITAFGGQWKEHLTNEVTHLFCLTATGSKYSQALNTQGHPLNIQVLLPHWFHESFQSEALLSTKNYLFPNPPRLNPDFNERMIVKGDPDDTPENSKEMAQRQLLRAAIAAELDSSNPGTQPSSSNKSVFSNRVLGDKRVVFSARAVQNDPSRDQVYRRRVEQVGGIYISGLNLGGDGVSQAVLNDADVFITSYRGNDEYDLATKCNVIIGTPAWILYITSTGLWSSPKEHLLHYPYPELPVPGFEDQQITITNYAGDAREYLKKLISALGGKFTPSLTLKNACVIASHTAIPSESSKQNKISKAREWRIPIVNHLWLEDCFREWSKLPLSDLKYLNFPEGHDWTQEINARGVGNGPLPPVPHDKKPQVYQNGHSVRAPSEVDGVSRPTSPAKPPSTLKAAPAPKPTSTAKPRSASRPASSRQAKNGAPSTDGAPSLASPSKTSKVESTKRKTDADSSQSTKRPKTTQPGNDAVPSPSKLADRQLSETVSAASSSSFVKPLSEVQHRGPIKLLSPDKGKRKPRKSSSDDEGSNHDSDSSSSPEPRAPRKPSLPNTSMPTGGRTQRAAASAAQDILRNVIMPDVQKFQNEMSSSKGDVRKMEKLAEKKQRRSSMVNHDNDDAPPPKKKKVQGDDDTKPKKSQALKSSQGKNEPKKESEKSASNSKSKSKPPEDEKPRKSISNSSVRIVCSKSKPTDSEIKQMERLGASFTEDDPSQCTHLVVNSISRTEKFLCAFPACDHVVTMQWLQDSIKEGKLQDEGQYRLSDPENEKRYGMSLSESLKRIKANKGKLLEGHTFFVTDKVGVDFKSMQRVIESSGGVAKSELKPTKKKIGNDTKHNHVISSQEAKPNWQALIKEDIPIYSKEFILNGILRQALDWNTDRIH